MDILEIEILSAISKIKKAWDGVNVSTIVNCFKKDGCNGEDFFGDDSKDEIYILQRYCFAKDPSISTE